MEKFTKEKIRVINWISKELLNDFEVRCGFEDFVKNEMYIELSAIIYSNLADERELVYFCKRPTFMDWILRRREKAKFNLKIKDLLSIPEKTKGTIRTFDITMV